MRFWVPPMLATNTENTSGSRSPAPFLVGALVVVALVAGAGLLAVGVSRAVESSSRQVLAASLPRMRATTELELLLFGQKDLTANYLLDGDRRWLDALEEQRGRSEAWFARARSVPAAAVEREALDR